MTKKPLQLTSSKHPTSGNKEAAEKFIQKNSKKGFKKRFGEVVLALDNSKFFLLIPALLVVLGGGGFSVHSTYHNSLNECQKIVLKYQDVLEDTNQYCQDFVYWERSQNIKKVAQTKNSLEELRTQKLDEVKILGEKISDLQKQADGLGLKPIQKDFNDTNNTLQKIDLLKKYQTDLVQQIGNEQQNVYQQIRLFEYLIEEYQNLPIDREKDWLKNYLELSDSEKNVEFTNFIAKTEDTKLKIYNILRSEDKNHGLSYQKFFEFKIFEADDFVNLGDSFIQQKEEKDLQKEQDIELEGDLSNELVVINSQGEASLSKPEEDLPLITGQKTWDDFIWEKAQSLGYQTRYLANEEDLVEFSQNQKTFLVNKLARNDLENLVNYAKSENINLNVSSAFRNQEDQRQLFLTRLNSACVSFYHKGCNFSSKPESNLQAIDFVLKTAAVPLASKHHTGITVDFMNDVPGQPFADSKAFEWLSQNNYYNAKKFGFIPSYPDEATRKGPEPEAWEYVWVGVDNLKLNF